MGQTPEQSSGTRQRILKAAGEVFAEKGYRHATVAEICRLAGANIAAINYHFGNKETLYAESWRLAHQAMLKASPIDGGVADDAPAEQRLRGRIRSMLQRAICDDGLEFRIMAHEMANPTGLLEQVQKDSIGPLAQGTEKIILELLGGQVDEPLLRVCVASVIGPCLQVVRRQQMSRQLGQSPWFDEKSMEVLVEHFATFALAGIRETSRRLKERSAATPDRESNS
jgi:TetR/AcrR family transcriptional regulator, regulator of cefoperazone and chloramphenicol sensitivity